jgi:hypothetical protein
MSQNSSAGGLDNEVVYAELPQMAKKVPATAATAQASVGLGADHADGAE